MLRVSLSWKHSDWVSLLVSSAAPFIYTWIRHMWYAQEHIRRGLSALDRSICILHATAQPKYFFSLCLFARLAFCTFVSTLVDTLKTAGLSTQSLQAVSSRHHPFLAVQPPFLSKRANPKPYLPLPSWQLQEPSEPPSR